MIRCPFHAELNEVVTGHHVSTFDDEEYNGVGVVEIVRFACDLDPTHVWEHPSSNFWLRWGAWGADWRSRRDRWTTPS